MTLQHPGTAAGDSARSPGATASLTARRGGGCVDEVRQALPQELTVSVWSPDGLPAHLQDPLLRIRGRRIDVDGRGERFARDESLADVPAGQPFAITVRISDVTEGQWETSATVIPGAAGRNRQARRRQPDGQALERVAWSWRRWAPRDAPASPVAAGPMLLTRLPGVARGAWAIAVMVAVVAALLTQQALLAQAGLDRRWGLVSLLAAAVGAGGARLWYFVLNRYFVLHRDRPGSGGG